MDIDWDKNIENREEKEKLAQKLAQRVKEGEVIGFGSGSTSYLTVIEIAKRIKKEKLKIKAITTSNKIEKLCKKFGIETTTLTEEKPNWCFDGADEVDNNNWLIKGMGAALYKEKLNFLNSKENYVLVDSTKFVTFLGERHPVPVECEKSAITYVKEELVKLGAVKIEIRKVKQQKKELITDNGNYILDVWFEKIEEKLEKKIKEITGVLESGLFINYSIQIIK